MWDCMRGVALTSTKKRRNVGRQGSRGDLQVM